jgi:uncharacterized damage-inducible protein DinB
VTPEEQIRHVQSSVSKLLEQIEDLPADVLYREPSAGEWPVMSTLAHVAELLPYWAHQAERIASSPGTTFGRSHDDPDRVGAVEQHGHDSLDSAVQRLRASLDECLRTLRALPAEAWSKTGEHPRRGSMTVADVVEALLVEHTDEHVAQVSATLGAVSPAESV